MTTTATGRLAGLRLAPGSPTPFGATPTADGVNFAVAAARADRMWLVLMDRDDGSVLTELEFPPEHRVGEVFTAHVLGLVPADADYGFRVERAGERGPVLLDPDARLLAGAGEWGRRPAYRSRIATPDFDWGDDRPPRVPTEDLVVYELHVRGFTRSETSGVAAPGTFAGLAEKIPYLRWLGVNCVELMPVFEFDETDNVHVHPETGVPLLNTWGYSPVGVFAPKANYARGERPDVELKELVKQLHAAGIEVVLDVVFNHTSEGDHRGPTLSLRGLDESSYYLLDESGRHRNFSGAGNTLNANHPLVREWVVRSLRHWVHEYHVDGFRFDLASVLTRGRDGAPLADPPLVAALAADPVLAGTRLIAEAWDAGGLYQVGAFPHYGRWMEWNGRYRDALRAFLVGRGGTTGDVATRLVGSPDLYSGRGATASVNFVTCHDGFTLADWASYDHKHNHLNGEDGRDGEDHNASWNGGVEGPTDDPEVLGTRARQVRNALLLLLTSRGVPMLLAGDEFGRTQGGNNNAYPHDGPSTWVDWSLVDRNRDLVEFTRACLEFRRAHPVLRRAEHPHGESTPDGGYPPVSWHGERAWQPDWSADSHLVIAMIHDPNPGGAGLSDRLDTVVVAANAGSEDKEVALPQPPADSTWRVFANTGFARPLDAATTLRDGHVLRLPARSAAVLWAHTSSNEEGSG
ncbi:isoamylase [Actinosynnema sp. NPDC002837]